MLVKNLMIQDVHTLRPENKLREVEEVMSMKNSLHTICITILQRLASLINNYTLKCTCSSSLLNDQRYVVNNRLMEDLWKMEVET